MSLNAIVYCDCVEKGRVKIRHPRPDLLLIDETGSPAISSSDPRDIEAHDRWESLQPCEHQHFWLIERWLGNVSSIGSIRELLKQYSSDPAGEYPVLWSRVLYDGSHSGDFLTSDAVQQLSDEVDRLGKLKNDGINTPFVELLRKLEDLVQVSRNINKPISF